MIERVHFHRFKQYRDTSFGLRPSGISLVAGGNNSGKSTLLHGLAVWEFCRTVIEMERGPQALRAGSRRQGIGLGDEDFSPLSVPTLSHLWTNLQTQRNKDEDADGYTLRIRNDWTDSDHQPKHLTFGLSLANDRLFVKTLDSDLVDTDHIPRVAYLPPFAGIVDKEARVSPAIRRRRIGEGVAGAVLRNLLLDMQQRNVHKREDLRGDRKKIRDRDLRNLRQTDPWERLQQTLRKTFGAELDVKPFRDEYHSYIRVHITKGELDKYRIRRYKGFRDRDVMVEGGGFLQWLSVFALAFDPDIDTLLLDEPDAHLHPSLQTVMLEALSKELPDKQILLATHSSEMIKRSIPTHILETRGSKSHRYLKNDYQKVTLLEGLGSDYAPHIDQLQRTRKALFIEGKNDQDVLSVLAEKLERTFPGGWVVWKTAKTHSERSHLFLGLRDEIEELQAISLRDRDDVNVNRIEADLTEKGSTPQEHFTRLTWTRRAIENYLIEPTAIATACGEDVAAVEARLSKEFALSIGETFPAHKAPQGILDADGKLILKEFGVHPVEVAKALPTERIPEDIIAFFNRLTP